MNRKIVVLGLCFLVMAGAANAVHTWFGGVGDWEVPANWDAGTVPTAANFDQANFISGTCTVTTMDASAQAIIMGFGIENVTTTLNINADAKLSLPNSELICGFYVGTNTNAVVNVEGIAALASLRVAGQDVGCQGEVNVNGGFLNVTAFGTYIGTNWEAYVAGVPVPKGVGTINLDNGGIMRVVGMGANGYRFDVAANGSAINILDDASIFKVLDDCEDYMQGLMDDGRITGRDVAWFNAADGYTYAVPEPATMILLGLGGLLIRRKRA